MSNYLKTVTIVGASGHVGLPIATSLLAHGKHIITALTRPTSTSTLPAGLHAVNRVDFSSIPSLTAALAGQDVLIVTLGVMTPADVQHRLIDAAIAVGVRYVMLNEWGIDIDDERLSKESGGGDAAWKIREYATEKMKGGRTKWLALTNGSWYEHSLMIPGAFGFDFKEKRVTFYDVGRQRISVSTWRQCGEAVAGLLALKVEHENEDGDELSVSHFGNGPVYVSSFAVTQREIFGSVLRVMGDKESEWTVDFENSEERRQRGLELFKEGQFAKGHVLRLYARIFSPQGGADHEAKVVNAELGLKGEVLDEATARAVELAKEGYRYGPH